MICSLNQLYFPLFKSHSPSFHMHKKESTLETMASRYSTMMLALLLGCLVMTAQSTNYSLHEDGDCDILGPCKTKADCAKPCKAAGHSPTAVLCVPDPTGSNRGTVCCCITA
ncbi:hypothetical protein C4D60_Mb06t29760 [Musa balbisiana]|uniref:Uncharacterized protein n=1 Tax=Musa balbisiana TaxID=52838 RepID=A0A4S8IRM0_MUSBA|nr:hypothetical protein C4D60_Mb06t29760 [Musa balbisiana]